MSSNNFGCLEIADIFFSFIVYVILIIVIDSVLMEIWILIFERLG